MVIDGEKGDLYDLVLQGVIFESSDIVRYYALEGNTIYLVTVGG